ncbi:MAG: TPM domain-containing protein [Verrucomicrobiae bacterium]|nr:TPM domain-containing protein [Verrucomicrobiae bacterium]
MKVKYFLSRLEEQEIIQTITKAEKKTSGEIRVMISSQKIKEPVAFAQRQFMKSKMYRTKERNAVLIMIAPHSQNFAVVGDKGIHEKVGDSFWSEISQAISEHFRKNEFHQGLISGVKRVGDSLAECFPIKQNDRNELSNQPL